MALRRLIMALMVRVTPRFCPDRQMVLRCLTDAGEIVNCCQRLIVCKSLIYLTNPTFLLFPSMSQYGNNLRHIWGWRHICAESNATLNALRPPPQRSVGTATGARRIGSLTSSIGKFSTPRKLIWLVATGQTNWMRVLAWGRGTRFVVSGLLA